MRRIKEEGFTAVELLVTLFVAAAFLIAGYQLFSLVIRDGGQTRSESRAGNVAYDYLRRYTSVATNPCTAQTPLTNSPVEISGLVNAQVTVDVSCPIGSTPSLSKVTATVSYNSLVESVSYSTFVNGAQ